MMEEKKTGRLADDHYEVITGIRYFMKTEPPSLDFVWPGFLTKSVGVLVAAGSTGKSFFAVQACMSVACGKDLFGLFGGAEIKAGPVTYVALEDDLLVFWHRIYGIANYLEHTLSRDEYANVEESMDRISIHGLYGKGYRPMTNDLVISDHFYQTMEHVEKHKSRLVVIDTYSRFLAGHSESDNAVASTIVSLIEQLCQTTGSSALILHHTNKASQFGGVQDGAGAARGASALTDNARWQSNMWVLPKEDAEAFGISEDERKSYVYCEATKINHGVPSGRQLLQRRRGGVLVGVDPLEEPRHGTKGKPDYER